MARILSSSDRAELSRLIAQVEQRTAGEIVTVVLRRSAGYEGYRLGWATGSAMLIAAGIHLAWPLLPPMELLGAQASLFVLGYVLFGQARFLRRMVPSKAQREATALRAKELFVDLGVTETRDRSGVLVLLSELERRAEILGDRGIHQHLGRQGWEALVADLVGNIRKGQPKRGLQALIERLGEELAAKFPRRADDVNELPDHVLVEPD